jgi:hypothetical protein
MDSCFQPRNYFELYGSGAGEMLKVTHDPIDRGSIVLMPLRLGLDAGWRHQSNGVAERLKFARPMMGRGTGFDTNHARRQLLKEGQHVAPFDLATVDDTALRGFEKPTFAISSPIVVIVCMGSSSESW